MKNLFIAVLALFTTIAYAQTHQIVKHNGEKLDVNYVRNQNNIVYYTLPGSTLENQISMYAINKLTRKTDNQLLVYSNKVMVSAESDFKNVVVLPAHQTIGLTNAEVIVKPVKMIKGHSPMSLVEMTKKRIKKEASLKGFPFVTFSEVQYGKIQAIAYKY